MERARPDVCPPDHEQQQLPLVVLLHGLLRTRADMNYLARSLPCEVSGNCTELTSSEVDNNLQSAGGYDKTLAGIATRCLIRQVVSPYKS